jgi:hypothetical protein
MHRFKPTYEPLLFSRQGLAKCQCCPNQFNATSNKEFTSLPPEYHKLILWSLWHERNSRLFEDVEVSVGALCRNVLNMLYLWVSAHSPDSLLFTIFYFLVRFFPLIRGTFVYFMCTMVAPLWAF